MPPGRRDLLGVVLLGLLLTLGAVFQQIGLVTTTVTNAGFLTALYVPLVPMLVMADSAPATALVGLADFARLSRWNVDALRCGKSESRHRRRVGDRQ